MNCYKEYRDALETSRRIGTTIEKMLEAYFASTKAWVCEDPDYETVRIRMLYPRGELFSAWSEYEEENLAEFWEWMYSIDDGLPPTR